MGLLDQIREDVKQFTSDTNDFGVELIFTPKSSEETYTINGIAINHSLTIDSGGAAVRGRQSHCSFSESLLTAQEYPLRNDKNQVDLKGHKVAWKDSTGVLKTYNIINWFPDETIGLIMCICSE